jgi:hypothetical protein
LCHECHEEFINDEEVLDFAQFLRRIGVPAPIFMGRPPSVIERS